MSISGTPNGLTSQYKQTRRGLLWGAALLALGAVGGGLASWLLLPGSSPAPRGTGSPAETPGLPSAETPQSLPVVFSTSPEPADATPALLPAGVPVIYLFYRLGGGEATDTPSRVRWSRNGQPLPDVIHQDIQPDPDTPGRGTVLLRPPNRSLPPGLYEAELSVGEARLAASFQAAWGAEEILQQPVPAAAEVKLSRAAMATGVKRDGSPERRLRTIGPDYGRLYFVFRFEQAEPGIALTVKWFVAGEELVAARQEVVLPATAGWGHAWAEAQPEWLPGEWRAVAYVSGDSEELASAVVTVR